VEYSGVQALQGVNLHFHCGELTAVVGPNGGGKSTLLKAILGEVRFSGEIRFQPSDGEPVMPVIGYVPQRVTVSHDTPMSVLDFMLLSMQTFPVWLGVRKNARKQAETALETVSAEHLIRRKIGELSGGELQRVLLARAMNPVPEILLLDEPVSGVDAKGLALFYETICDLRRRYDISIILVTHDIAAIAPHADRMLVLNKTLLADGTPSEVIADDALVRLLGHTVLKVSRIPDDSEIHGGSQ
jgi:zinc transport system ATP-binding protein